ncbi:MAG: phosphoribosylamine--glycine ligase [Flavisolibacter sp.]|jgi:phosphoribosylamine--glycine ligase|nr:phosphoribosylamine--glycine ligase [Flavisolibacter sp.]
MNILLLGSGGREHAIAWKLKQSTRCSKIFISPGNAGTAQVGVNKSFLITDFEAIKNCCIDENIDMLIVGPEEPLVKGIVDYLKKDKKLENLLIIGPSKEASQLEGSKAYAKEFMKRHKIPTAGYKEFDAKNFEEGLEYLHNQQLPIVLKADGLAAGKGVIICQNHIEAISEFELMIQRSKFGEAGKRVVVEEFLDGIELSVFVLTDGRNYILLPNAKDYKRIGEKDSGSNTGGMGAISPVPFADDAFMKKVISKIIEPTVKGLDKDNLEYTGFIFFGLIKVGDEPFVIEYNCRLGDPETEVILPRLKNDLVELLHAAATKDLKNITIEEDSRFASTVVAVSGGYPDEYEKGIAIHGLHNKITEPDLYIFHCGTIESNGSIVTNGGRVICATALADKLVDAVQKSKQEIKRIEFDKKYYRRDIGYEFV